MIIVKAAVGLVIELGLGDSGKWDALSIRLAEGISPRTFRFEVSANNHGRLRVRPLEAHEPADLVVALGVVLGHASNILAEVRKYSRESS
jgi:hypothetical protein